MPPRLFFSDLESGPNTGGVNNNGVFVTLYGKNFGSTQGTSYVTIGGGRAAAYPVWTDTKVTVQLGSAAASGNIVLTTSLGASKSVPFTVRAGNIYFVATNGNDSANGSYSTPWLTIQHARDAIAAGDTVYVRNGVTQLNDGSGWGCALLIKDGVGNSGAAGAPKAMVVYPGETATIGSTTGQGAGIRTASPGYWVFAGFNLRGVNEGIATYLAAYWRFVGNDITCPSGNGASACVETQYTTYSKFLGNNVHDVGATNASTEYHGVYFSTDSNHIEFGWNTIANVHGGRGLQVHSTNQSSTCGYDQYDILIHDNVIHDTQCDGIVLATVDPSKGPVQVYNNLIYNAGKGPNNPEQSGDWACIYSPGYTNNGTPGVGNIEVFGNTMYNCGSFATPPYGGSNYGVSNGGYNSSLKIRIRDNIIYQVNANAPYWNSGGIPDGVNGSNNLFYGIGAPPASTAISNSLNSNPAFVNLSAYNFHLSTGSPAANAGVTTPQTSDFDGVPLPQGSGYPIGALALVGGGGSTPPSSVSVSVSPSSVSLTAGKTQQFTASVSGTTNTGVTWSISPQAGSISGGLYTAPASITTSQTVTVIATSVADTTKSAGATVTLTPTATCSVGLNPTAATLTAGASQQFAATVTGVSNTSVTWSMSPQVGTLSGGLYTAPASISTSQTVTVTATAVADTTKSASAVVTLNPPNPPAGTANTIRVNAGGPSYTDSQNRTWSADTGYAGGSTFNSTHAITNTTMPALYQTERFGNAIYTSSVPNGTYSVTLRFAEIWFTKTGQRVFNVSLNGQQVLTNFDIVAQAGGAYIALDKQFTTSVTNGQVTIQLSAVVENPKISAIDIVPASAGVAVSVSPAASTLGPSKTQQFTAAVTGTTNTAVTWSISPQTGSISAAGLYTAPSSIASAQAVTVKATSAADSTKSASSFVTLQPATALFRVNAGGPAYTDPQGLAWSADTKYSGGYTYTTSNSIGNTTNPRIYQTERFGVMSYAFSVPSGTHTVKLHFAEIWFTAAGYRAFNVAINGLQVLSNFDIVAQAGGPNIAIQRQFNVNTTGTITISFSAVKENPKISAIEIY